MTPQEALKYHVTGAIERGEKKAVAGIEAKPIPKSLHTVRALAQMTRMAMQLDATLTADAAMYKVLVHLGYAGTSDAYDLKTKAMKQL